MLFWFIILAVAVVGVFGISVFRHIRPKAVSREEEEMARQQLEEKIGAVKEKTKLIAKSSGKLAQKNLMSAYNKSISAIKNTQVSNLVNGRGVLKKKETSSNFLKDVKEHKEKVREELRDSQE